MKTVDFDSLKIARGPLNDYGSLEGVVRGIRSHRPLDLNAEEWRKTRPSGSFGLWRQSAHSCLLVSCLSDSLFPPEAQHEAARQIQAGFDWADCGGNFYSFMPDKPHCYDAEIQREAIGWLDRHLK